ncbi:MAG: asparagine synthase (glutamine-hydrolyzing) [Candidatus Schekmanbacteria bacterium]|nr:asparagine synthase (glutamine-hydrolyzing) [Candidatus Schekmanbacteria bacterium]
MCGIVGFTGEDRPLLEAMTQIVAHRGPDGDGHYVGTGISLGHRRLSIIDLSAAGAEPMCNEDRTVWLVYNGEIYNHQDIRDWLEPRGHQLSSHTDAEVVLHAYEEEGAACLDRFIGMFAFALWDSRRGELFLARDRLGIKPLYYTLNHGRLSFASEVKALFCDRSVPREVDYQGLFYYLGHEYVPAPRSAFAGISKLPAAHYLRYRPADGFLQISRYWDITFPEGAALAAGRARPAAAWADEVRGALEEAVKRWLVSDVPVAVFLSGGLDSSSIVAFMARHYAGRLRTFSVGYADRSFSELSYARIVADHFGTDHEELIIQPPEPADVERVVWHLDEPMTDLSTLAFFLICRQAAKEVKVCMSGEGGDEVFAGYERFIASRLERRFYRFLPDALRRHTLPRLAGRLRDRPQKKGPVNLLKRFIAGAALPDDGLHMRWQYFLDDPLATRLLAPELLARIDPDAFAPYREALAHTAGADPLSRELYLDLTVPMANSVLSKVDRMSMAFGLEVRVPFLDHKLIETVSQVPAELKLRGMTTKWVLRQAMRDILPEPILTRKKQGYSLPLKNWLREDWREFLLDTLRSCPLIREICRPAGVQAVIDEHMSLRANHNHTLWALLNLALWHRRFVDTSAEAAAAPRALAREAAR